MFSTARYTNTFKEKHQDERAEREATRRAAYLADQRMQKNFKDLDSNDPKKREKNLAERAKYQFGKQIWDGRTKFSFVNLIL